MEERAQTQEAFLSKNGQILVKGWLRERQARLSLSVYVTTEGVA